MIRNIDILVEIQRRIYKFKFTEDDIAVALDVDDGSISGYVEIGDRNVFNLISTIKEIAVYLSLLTEDIKASMLNEGFDIDEYNEWTSSLMYNQYNLEGMLETIENALEILEVYILETMRGYRMLRQLVYDVDTHLPDYMDTEDED